MLTSRAWIISSGLVGAISLILRFAFKLSVTGTSSLSPTFIIHGIIFALAASVSLFGHGSDSPATEHHHDDDDRYYSEHDDHHHHDNNHNYDHDHNRSSNNSSNSSFDRFNNKVHEKEKFPKGSISSPEVRFLSSASEKSAGLRRPPTVPLKTFPKDDKSAEVSNDKDETMEEMWNRVKAEKHPNNSNSGISREDTRMSTSSSPSPSRARYPSSSSPSPSRARNLPSSSPSPSRARNLPSSSPSLSRARNPPSSPAQPGTKLMERIPSWLKLKKELSMGRDELNSRVEAFITKFNDEMKLQRLESIRRYKLFRRRSDEK